ncbi:MULTISPECIES: hypothetical protein [Amycolatopsis]|uniref:Protein kinase domain-containing protein n=1 Tax=Amycolatopsis bullii TaxID=941987 RepID=A0ABQ3JXR0_9PSEU|nr:hypothetical protein [Amycolatopsis bullii]GHF94893.1 hypothetical protein GCM10017567_06770 [Amycolatopsis bullii]
MTLEWPPPPDAKAGRLLAEVDVTELPHAAPFSACLEALAASTEVYAWVPCIANVNGRVQELHNHGVPHRDYKPSSIPVATPDAYQNAAAKPEFLHTVLQHLGTTPEHCLAFAEVLCGQDLNMGGTVTEDQEGYVTPIDWAYYNLAFFKQGDDGSASGDVKESLADLGQITSAQTAVTHADWSGPAKDAAVRKFAELVNFVIYVRGPMYAEFGATLIAYAALVKAARNQLDGIMAQTVAAMRRLEASNSGDVVKALAVLLTLAGFLPALPYSISFGIAAASAVVSAIDSKAKEKAPPAEIAIPADRAQSCVDILRWYLDEARATCEALADGVTKLTKRRVELLDEVLRTVPEANPVPDVLKALPA